MAFSERLALIVDAKTDGATRNLRKLSGETKQSGANADATEKKFRGLSTGLKVGIAVAAGIAGRKLMQFAGDAVRAASDLEQAVGGTKAVFGETGRVIDQFAKTSAESVGLSEAAFREATTLIGGQLKRMTGDVGFAADASVQLVQVGADLAATFGGSTKQAVEALAAALRGEADPAERFNLNLKASVVAAKAVELGLAASTTQVSEQARAQAILALVTEQSADAQGQFAREGDTVAVQLQKQNAEIENMKASIGRDLLPVQLQLTKAFRDAIPAIEGTGKALAFIVSNDYARSVAVGLAGIVVAGKAMTSATRQMEAFGIATDTAAKTTRLLALGIVSLGFAPLAIEIFQAARQTQDFNKYVDDTIAKIHTLSEEDPATLVRELNEAIAEQEAIIAANPLDVYNLDVKAARLLQAELKKELEETLEQQELAAIAAGRNARETYGAGLTADAYARLLAEETNPALDDFGQLADDAADKLRTLDGEMLNVTESDIALRDTIADWKKEIKEATKENEKHTHSLSLNTQRGRDNVSTLLEMVEQANAHRVAVEEQTGSVEKADDALRKDRKAILDAAEAAGFNRKKVAELIDGYLKIPAKKSTKIEQPHMKRSQRDTDNLRKKLQRVDGTWKAKISTPGLSGAISHAQTLINKLNRIDGRHVSFTVQGVQVGSGVTAAGGGLVQKFPAGGPVVGPGGPTDDRVRALLSNGEFVVNAAATKRNLALLRAINSGRAAAGGAMVVNFHFPHYVGSRQELIRAIRSEIRDRGGDVQKALIS